MERDGHSPPLPREGHQPWSSGRANFMAVARLLSTLAICSSYYQQGISIQTLVFYSFSVLRDTFVYHYTRIMPNFNDVYLDNYQVLDYGLTCKNNPKWGLVLVASGPDANLSCLNCVFLSFRHVHKIWRVM